MGELTTTYRAQKQPIKKVVKSVRNVNFLLVPRIGYPSSDTGCNIKIITN